MNRRELREHLFIMVFQKEFYRPEEMAAQGENYLTAMRLMDAGEPGEGAGEEGREPQARRVAEKELLERSGQVFSHLDEIDALLSEASTGWKLPRMNKVDLALLRVAVFEMKFDDRIPKKVAINEAVELAKHYGGDDSPAFVNAVLGKLMRGGMVDDTEGESAEAQDADAQKVQGGEPE